MDTGRDEGRPSVTASVTGHTSGHKGNAAKVLTLSPWCAAREWCAVPLPVSVQRRTNTNADPPVEVYALYLACKDPRVPWYAKALATCVVGYALSPIDLIPDPIPVIGHLDDLVLIPLGVFAVRRMIPESVMTECRERAHIVMQQGMPMSRTAAVVIVALW